MTMVIIMIILTWDLAARRHHRLIIPEDITPVEDIPVVITLEDIITNDEDSSPAWRNRAGLDGFL